MGLTNQGLIRDTIEELEQQAKDNFIATFEDPLNNLTPSVEPDSFFGLLAGLIAEIRNQNQENIEEVYYSRFIKTASGVSLDRVAAPTEREEATKSEVILKFTGTPGVEILGGSLAETAEKIQFQTTASVLIGGGGEVEILARAVIAGPAGNVPSGSITFLPVPIAGVDSVTNDLQSTGGTSLQDDPDFRDKAIVERSGGKTSSLDSIVRAVDAVPNVSTVIGIENTGLVPDGGGRPPGSFEITARGGDDTAIAEAILATKSAGVETFGSITVPLLDTSGNIVNISFSRPTLKEVYVQFDLTVNAAYIADQDDIIRQLTLDYIGGINPSLVESPGLNIGEDVFAFKTQGVLFELDNPRRLVGILGAVTKVADVATPIDQDQIAIAGNQEAVTDFTKIIINKVVV